MQGRRRESPPASRHPYLPAFSRECSIFSPANPDHWSDHLRAARPKRFAAAGVRFRLMLGAAVIAGGLFVPSVQIRAAERPNIVLLWATTMAGTRPAITDTRFSRRRCSTRWPPPACAWIAFTQGIQLLADPRNRDHRAPPQSLRDVQPRLVAPPREDRHRPPPSSRRLRLRPLWQVAPGTGEGASPTNPGAMGFEEWVSPTISSSWTRISRATADRPNSSRVKAPRLSWRKHYASSIGRSRAVRDPFFVVVWFGSPHEPYSGRARISRSTTSCPRASRTAACS